MKTDRVKRLRVNAPSKLCLACLISGLLPLFSLTSIYGQNATVSLELAPELRNAQIIRVSDFNVTGSGSVSQLFTLDVTYFGPPTNLVLTFQLISDKFSATPIVIATTRPFAVFDGFRKSFTYQDFRNGNIDYNAQAVSDLTNAILQTSRLPEGTYTFSVTVSPQGQNNPIGADQEILQIANPTTLDLISPGAPVGRNECPTVFGQLPQFKWDSNANRFLITICEVLPTNSSPEDVMQNQPRLRRTLRRDVDFFGVPTFLYPPTELPLEYGKTYLWQIQALVDSPSGEISLPGEIWCFRVNPLAGAGEGILLQQLLNLLNSDEVNALFEEGGPLYGHTPTGAVMTNGQRINLSDLLAQLRNQPLQIKSVEVE